MVVMVILSMMLLTMDGIFSDTSANLWLLGMLIGSAAFGIAGIASGRWIQWGIGGAVLGTILGLVLPGFAAGGGLSSSVGTFNQAKLDDLGTRRSIANQFMSQVDPMARFRGASFGYGQRNMNIDLIFGRLMQEEADDLGIAIDNEGVARYLEEVGQGELTKEKYLSLRNSMSYQGKPLDEETFQGILSDEIRGRLAYMMLQTRTTSTPPGPEVYWQYFRRLKVRQQIEVATLEVEQFLGQVTEPTDGEVKELFESYKNYFPNNKEPGSPGFALPTRANLAYIELDAQAVEDSLDPVTDEDVKKYYEDNKETPLIRSIVISDDAMDTPAEGDAAEDKTPEDKTSEDKPAVDEKPADSEAAKESTEDKAADPAKPADDKKPAAEEAKDDEVAAAEKTTEEAAEEVAADKNEPKKTEPKKEEAEKAPADEKKAAEPKKEEVKERAAKKPVFNQEQADKTQAEAAETSETAKSETVKAETQKAETQKAEEATTEETKPKETQAGDAKTDDAKSTDAAESEKSDKPAAGGLKIPDVPEFDESAMPEPEYEYRELDEELSKQIRELIMAERVSEEMNSRMKSAKGEMELLARKYGEQRMLMIEENPSKYDASGDDYQEALKSLREDMSGFYDELNADLTKLGKKYGFAYVETGLIGGQELQSSEDFTIGAATEPSANPMMQFQATPVVNVVYSGLSNDEQSNAGLMFQVSEAVRPGSAADEPERRFLYWVTDVSPQHIPEFDEPGVRESVVKAWKAMKARDVVKSRGEKLAKMVKAGLSKEGDDKQNLVEALEGETVTGKEDGVPLARRVSMPFSWMRVTQAPQMSFQGPRAERSIITFQQDGGAPLDLIGDRFMSTIFEDMKDGDVQVVPNFDYSAYHVVHVTNRFPTPEIGGEDLREDFAKESQQNGFRNSPILPVMSGDLNGPPARAWEESIWKKYKIDLTGDGE